MRKAPAPSVTPLGPVGAGEGDPVGTRASRKTGASVQGIRGAPVPKVEAASSIPTRTPGSGRPSPSETVPSMEEPATRRRSRSTSPASGTAMTASLPGFGPSTTRDHASSVAPGRKSPRALTASIPTPGRAPEMR